MPYASAATRARRAVRSLRLFLAAGVLELVAIGLILLVPDQMAHHATAPLNALGFLAGLTFLLGTGGVLMAFIASSVTFVMWFHRVYRNLPAIGAARRHKSAWAAYIWFIPILNLGYPSLAVGEAWDASHRLPPRPKKLLGSSIDRRVSSWWLFFVAPGIIARFLPASDVTTPRTLVPTALVWLGLMASYMVAAYLAIGMIRDLQVAQDTAALGGPPMPQVQP